MDSKITYYLGAGASYNSIPILDELALAMRNFHIHVDDESIEQFGAITINSKNPFEKNSLPYWRYEFNQLGIISEDFGTIDTYAKKLHVQRDFIELKRIKHSLSVFFTAWQFSRFKEINGINSSNGERKRRAAQLVDKRYIALIAAYIEDGAVIPKNINFISWNYDLQLELAFSKFLDQGGLSKVNSLLKFYSGPTSTIEQQVFHLNGFSGFFLSENHSLQSVIDIDEPLCKTNEELLNKISERVEKSSLDNLINYAWEDYQFVPQNTRPRALNGVNETNILVIIGYSFPIFNRSIDKLFFKQMLNSGNLRQIIYQDPNANELFLKNTFEIPEFGRTKSGPYGVEIIIEKNVSQFAIPNI